MNRWIRWCLVFSAVTMVGCSDSPREEAQVEKASQGSTNLESDLQSDQDRPQSDSAEAADMPSLPASSSDKVVVYSARKEHLIKPLFDQFTQETGIQVEYITDKAGPLIERVRESKTILRQTYCS